MRRMLTRAAVAVLAVGAMSTGAGLTQFGAEVEVAQAQKPGGGSGNSAQKAGDNLADLISDNVGPMLIVLVGIFGLLAFTQRSIGMAVTATIVGLFAGLFIIEPNAAEGLFKDIYKIVF